MIETRENRVSTEPPSGFVVEDVTVGSFAHGFGTCDGLPFAFRTVGPTLFLEVYRAGVVGEVPGPEDVVAAAQVRVTDVDLDDERSVVALVRDMIADAVPVESVADGNVTTVRALLGRIGSVMDGM